METSIDRLSKEELVFVTNIYQVSVMERKGTPKREDGLGNRHACDINALQESRGMMKSISCRFLSDSCNQLPDRIKRSVAGCS
jgi:hypothetical protein